MIPQRTRLACLLSLAVLATPFAAGAQAAPASASTAGSSSMSAPMSAADRAAIEQVVERFRTAIIAKDKPGFLALFLPGTVAWESAIGDESLRRLRGKRPETQKVKPDPQHNPVSFIDGIVTEPRSTEEKFRNLRIDGDADVASVVFDYSFHEGGRETNSGVEAWHLVRTEQGWRIVSVIWSMNLPPKPATAG
ncbi:nuclear transport factor 2 family protein [Pseudoxanthomonas beigongshangi]|uniref:nuclear transport factor 2 family protein n=1 Tax=Pseudoxanthomonas beigongshangi TaxID=2782537 RepID=UPI00193B3AC9|nr:nuclear transport factor 2 family protein [Pseudoxanthomonas beigongshangi]